MSDLDYLTDGDLYVPDSIIKSKMDFKLKYRKNAETIAEFLGNSSRVVEGFGLPLFYADFLAWGLSKLTESSDFKVFGILGPSDEPIYSNVQTDYEVHESCLTDGVMLIEKNGIRMAITIVSNGYIQIAVNPENREEAKKLLLEINQYMDDHNYYKGKRIKFDGKISFLDVKQKEWDSIILDADVKTSIRLNAVGFLRNIAQIEKVGIPPKRGIILAGDPGTGKTIICKALMTEAVNITCITTEAYGQYSGGYISDLYYLADDLSPSIVFLEDIDFIGQERQEIYHGNPPLLTLLAEMDGITEKKGIVTVATSNFFETLDKALCERPSRFDCVYKINLPNPKQRTELVKNIAEKIPCSENVQEHIVTNTEGFTPAQIQGVLHSMAISQIANGQENMQFTNTDVDSAIAQINYKKNGTMGFCRVP
ncbi:AAA family ATPase [Chloroflexota bacterium]